MLSQPVALALPEVLCYERPVTSDARGHFMELWREHAYAPDGTPLHFVQDNVSHSKQGVLRGLHLQHPKAQGKLITVLSGEVFDVAVDVRVGSPRFGKWCGLELSSSNGCQLYIPPGFAHGFVVLSDSALVLYKCTAYYAPENELTILWDDRDIGIAWPIGQPRLSVKDQQGRPLSELPEDRLPRYT